MENFKELSYDEMQKIDGGSNPLSVIWKVLSGSYKIGKVLGDIIYGN